MEREPPHEVVVIAQELGLAFKGCAADGLEYYKNVAYRIYERLLKEQQAAIKAQLAPDD